MRCHVAQLDLARGELVAADDHDVGRARLIRQLELGLKRLALVVALGADATGA